MILVSWILILVQKAKKIYQTYNKMIEVQAESGSGSKPMGMNMSGLHGFL
jgi:hypothetical protein